MTRLLVVALVALVALPLGAQRGSRCRVEVLNVDREGAQLTPFPGYVNYFGGGNVRLGCVGQQVRLGGDSLISLNTDVIYLFRNARYSDESIRLIADSLIYSKQAERIEARGAVTVTNIRTGSTITGPYIDYLRAVQGIRDSAEVVALERPTVRYVPTRGVRDTAAVAPYVIVANLLRATGSSRVWGSGDVTIDRESLAGRADSMSYLTGAQNELELIGIAGLASVRDTASDSLLVEGKRVFMDLADDDLRRVRALGQGHVKSGNADVLADSVSIALDSGKVTTTAAWSRTSGATVRNEGYDIRGDSIWISTPGERLREVRVFGNGVIQNPEDTTKAIVPALDSLVPDSMKAAFDDERDTLWGDRITASFADVDSSGTVITRLRQIVAIGTAASLFSRDVARGGTTSPSITYTRADTIVVLMRTDDTTGVLQVRARRGAQPVDGIQLERASLRRTGTTTNGAARREERP